MNPHEEMTALCRDENCLVCGRYGCEPCHWPKHRGMGGRNAGWSVEEIVPLCRLCHDRLDRRNGVSREESFKSDLVLAIVAKKAEQWRERQRDMLGALEE